MLIIKTRLIKFLVFFLIAQKSVCQPLRDSSYLYYNKNEFDKAIEISKKAIAEYEKDKNDSMCIRSLNDVGYFYKQKGDFRNARIFYEKASNLRKEYFGEKNSEYATGLLNIAEIDKGEGRLWEAELKIKKAISIFEYKNEIGTLPYSIALNNLGALYSTMEDYSQSEIFNKRATQLRNELFGESSFEYGLSLNNLATLYVQTGNFTTAEPLLKKSVSIFKNGFQTYVRTYASVKRNLATLYYKIGKYDISDTLLHDCLKIFEEAVGNENEEYAFTLNELGHLYYYKNNCSLSKKFFNEALAIREKKLEKYSMELANTYNGLARLYTICNKIEKPDSFFLKALSISEKILGEDNVVYLNYLSSLGNYYLETKRRVEADKAFVKILFKENLLLKNKLEYMSESELDAYISSRTSSIKLPFILLTEYNSSELLEAIYNNQLSFKGASLQNFDNIIREVSTNKEILAEQYWKKYRQCKFLISKLLSSPLSKRFMNVDSLSEISNQKEKELSKISAAYRNIKSKLSVSYFDVHTNLKIQEVAIEFVSFFSVKDSTTYYAALLLRPQDTVPIFIKLCEEEQLKNALKAFPYKATGSYQIAGSKVSSQSIYQLLWQPLEPYLKNTQTVYFSPDGLLHQIAFAAIPYKSGLLCDKYNLVQLTSTRQIAVKDSVSTPSFTALFGGINYNRQTNDTTTGHPDPYAYVYRQNRSTNMDSFPFLPGTVQEVAYIQEDLAKQHKNVHLFSGTNATEAAFRHLGDSTSPQIIHFATHGFTLPDPVKTTQPGSTDNVFKISDNPLLRCGLVMAGGNRGWKGKSSLEEDDGILTGLEISNVPLLNTQLVVLSACETGTGKLIGTEGIFGLQRAFKLAGANYVMASLWPVPDKETAEFMKDFYDQLTTGQSIRQAFIRTQQAMRKKYSPYYWAAFTLVQ